MCEPLNEEIIKIVIDNSEKNCYYIVEIKRVAIDTIKEVVRKVFIARIKSVRKECVKWQLY